MYLFIIVMRMRNDSCEIYWNWFSSKQKDSFQWSIWKWMNWSFVNIAVLAIVFTAPSGKTQYVCTHSGESDAQKLRVDALYYTIHTHTPSTNEQLNACAANLKWLVHTLTAIRVMGENLRWGRLREREKYARYFVYCMNLGLQFEFMWRFMLLCIFVL